MYIISIKFMDPESNKMGTIIKLIDTSYEIIWEIDRRPPKRAYLELLDHPANIIPYTPNADITNIYNKLKLISTI
jgi:hypothetical protein